MQLRTTLVNIKSTYHPTKIHVQQTSPSGCRVINSLEKSHVEPSSHRLQTLWFVKSIRIDTFIFIF